MTRSLARRRRSEFVSHSNTRARRMGCEGTLSVAELPEEPGPCHYCGGEATGWDHVIALGDGGPNVRANLVPACITCNRRKGDGQRFRMASRRARPTRYGRRPCGHAIEPRRLNSCQHCERGPSRVPGMCRSNAHYFTPENTKLNAAGQRRCRECGRSARRDRYRRKVGVSS